MADANGLALELSRDEALVLFEWLLRTEDIRGAPLFEHPAERWVLWGIENSLQALIHETGEDEYPERVSAARDRIERDNELAG